jgi:hypothetical protein
MHEVIVMKSLHLWLLALVGAFVLGGLFFGKGSISNILPYAIFLICPLMMIFMMREHGTDDKHKH